MRAIATTYRRGLAWLAGAYGFALGGGLALSVTEPWSAAPRVALGAAIVLGTLGFIGSVADFITTPAPIADIEITWERTTK